MSLILDALNRARGEPADGRVVPGLDSQHFPPVESAVGWRQRVLPALLLLALLVIAGLLWRQFAAAPPVAGPEKVRAPVPLAPAPPPARPTAVPVTSAPEVAALYRQEVSAPDIREDAETGADADSEAGNSASDDDMAVDVDSLVSAAEQALDDVQLAQHPVSFLAALSQQRKDAIPTLMYLQHDYRGEGGSRVTINGTEAAAGESVGRGVVVEEILPDSVVLSHDGKQFRLRALNSWVNL
ncbi:general secretion pathway protein GspB [Kineobactrum salinum]|uniref:General secretion pathway protein GspB n=1 Tax=Kineobactrum salinum TaxID=2708301 RepID=A0A6C0U477_9GAMM|nr:general secretion pathway protein GspB [Kineobactrum salinum]QIB66738.1 general secretion pathway protein GspB [Kineobactrum salinum]